MECEWGVIGPVDWQLSGWTLTGVDVGGVVVDLLVEPVPGEVARRTRVGPSRALSWYELDLIAPLAWNEPVPWPEVPLELQVDLDHLPPGALVVGPRHLKRVWRPTLTVNAISRTVRETTRGHKALSAVSQFAAVAPRILICMDTAPSEELASAARQVGVGLLDASSERPLAVVGPPSRRHIRDDQVAWEVSEAAYAHITTKPRLQSMQPSGTG